MARNRNIELSTIIGKGSRFTGDLSVQGGLRIDGEIDGKIESTGFVVIGPSGYAKSGIKAEECLVSGKVEGDIVVKDGLELDKNARITGNITARMLKVHTGALFTGNCRMDSNKQSGLNPILRKDDVEETKTS